MDKIDKLFNRMTRDMIDYFTAGGLAEPDGLIRTVEFFLSFVDKGALSAKLLDKKVVKDALINDLPAHMPLFVDESFYAYQILLDLYYALYKEKVITKEECKNMQFFIYLNKADFLTRMSNPSYWSEAKLAVMDEWSEGNFDLEDPYNIDEYELEETPRKKAPDNILEFPGHRRDEKSAKSYIVRVDLKGYRPPIWRRLRIPAGITYGRLHRILQIAFEWENSHLHGFFAEPGEMIGPSETEMAQFQEEERSIDEDFQEGAKIEYIYDFGCDWEHRIAVEKVVLNEEEMPFQHAVCMKAKGDTPKEDSKGSESWQPLDLKSINKRLERV